MRRRRQIRIAHAEIDDVRSRIAGPRLGPVHLFEHIGRQAADAVEVFHRLKPSESAYFCLRMILSENRFPLFRIMRWLPSPAHRRYPDWLLSRVGLDAILGAIFDAGGRAVLGVRGLLFLGLRGLFFGPLATFLLVAGRGQVLFQL